MAEIETGSVEAADPRAHFVASGETVDYEYQIGLFDSGTNGEGDSFPTCSVAIVAEVDGLLLIAIPEGAWHKTKKKRAINPEALKKAVAVLVPCSSAADRSTPDAEPTTKIWLGLIGSEFEAGLYFSEEAASISFPVDESGVERAPYAASLVAVSKDHFTFMTAESEKVEPPPGLDAEMDRRIAALESGLAAIQERLKELKPKPTAPTLRPKARPHSGVRATAGVEPGLARQAAAAGVTSGALDEMAAILAGRGPGPTPVGAPPVEVPSSEDEDIIEDPAAAGGGSGSGDPMATAVLQLSKIMSQMQKDKKKQKGKTLDSILEHAESGSAKEAPTGSSRSKAAALLSLQRLLVTNPKLIYTSIESRLQEDWELATPLPGVQSSSISARGWIEHRSRIQNYPSSVRFAWLMGGVWDCLRQNKVEEARARSALAVALLDQQSCDSGSWLLAGELSLEAPPPYSSFASHSAPSSWELPHTRLIDQRWVDLAMSKLRDLADFHEKRQRLGSERRKTHEDATIAEPKVKPKPAPKPKTKGAGKGKESTAAAESAAETNH